jgi:matrix metalloproteinase-21
MRRSISVEIHEGPAFEDAKSGADDRTRFQKDENRPVQWRLLADGVSGKIPVTDQRAVLELAFRMWSEVIPLKFNEANKLTDVVIAFAKQSHMNCDKPFDGHGGELAHSWTGGDIHFDEDENYKRDDPTGTGINLLKVAVHEIGHVLGLLHSDRGESIMYPIYVNPEMYDDFELCRDDRKAVQDIYGVCKGRFDVVFDWLRKVRATDGSGATRYIFNTYFFRGRRYWMYENRFNRTRFGDPLYIEREWTGLPGVIDAYVQIISPAAGAYKIDTYFFSGDSYYKYDDDVDRVAVGYPRKISADFGPKPNGSDVIPNNLDAVLFDNRDSMLYFFKGDWVWIYNSQEIGRNACCEAKVTFSSLYPTSTISQSSANQPGVDSSTVVTSSSGQLRQLSTINHVQSTVPTVSHPPTPRAQPLTGHIDAVFYSYHFHQMFFFQGESVYVNAAYDERLAGSNRLEYRGHWYDIWFDICDVE